MPSDYKAWSKILLLDAAGYGSVKLAIGLSMRGVNEIVGVKPANSIVTFCKKIKRTADDARIARTPLALAIDSSHAVVLASGALERVLARLGLGPVRAGRWPCSSMADAMACEPSSDDRRRAWHHRVE